MKRTNGRQMSRLNVLGVSKTNIIKVFCHPIFIVNYERLAHVFSKIIINYSDLREFLSQMLGAVKLSFIIATISKLTIRVIFCKDV